jgi:putative serine protease PepD
MHHTARDVDARMTMTELDQGTEDPALLEALLAADPAIRYVAIGPAICDALALPGGPTVAEGIVSATDRTIQTNDGATLSHVRQTDAAINPGNSGGPLVDMTGAVVGINSSIRTAAGESPFGGSGAGSIGLGFAIPIDEVMPIVDQITAGETPTHARLGIQVSDSRVEGLTGAQVQEVTAGSTADEAGLEPGDVITRVDETHITGADSLVATIRSYRPGDTVTVTWTRDGDEQSADMELDSDAE